MEELDSTLQEADKTKLVSTKYTATDTTDGISAENIRLLNIRYDDADAKNTAQKKLVERLGNLTDRQNELMAKSLGLIRSAQNAARSVYGKKNKPMMSEFHVGGPTLTTVKGMRSELKYMKSVVTDRKDDLARGGFKAADIPEFDADEADLTAVDAEQEDVKKIQKGATALRNESMHALKEIIQSIRASAQVIFRDHPEILVEFEPLGGGRGPGGKGKNPPPPDQPPK